ncbi:MAG: hypothetical protein A4E67_02581 [Syntrophaceae bacterium PtaB.Bin038]|nr:MAG: hypothetical protein A4E67_02581 [Syntrophaceae bacterium PtaB.Bin038]
MTNGSMIKPFCLTIKKPVPPVKGYLTARPDRQSLPVQAAISRIPSRILGPSRKTASLV